MGRVGPRGSDGEREDEAQSAMRLLHGAACAGARVDPARDGALLVVPLEEAGALFGEGRVIQGALELLRRRVEGAVAPECWLSVVVQHRGRVAVGGVRASSTERASRMGADEKHARSAAAGRIRSEAASLRCSQRWC